MSDDRHPRRLNVLLGVFLVGLAGVVVVLFGGSLLRRPLLAGQVLLLGLAGVCDLVAATVGRPTGRLAWYRWSGLGNILLGLSLPLGFVGSGSDLFFVLVTGVGGLSLAAIGVDLLAFHGQYTRGTPLDHDSN